MSLNLIIVLIYILFYINFFLSISFIPSLIVYFMNPSKSKKYFIFIKNILISSISFISKILLFPNIYVNSNNIINYDNDENKNLFISNHPSELDFLLGSIFFSNTNLFTKNIGIAKKMVGYQIPTLGFYGMLSNDIFLQRNIEVDKNKLNKNIDFNYLLIYPEGTCFNKHRKLISDNYCDKNNLCKFKYHLYPRTTGVELIINNNKTINNIYDFTIIYDGIIKDKYDLHHNTINYLFGKLKIPDKIFIQVKKYEINTTKKFNKKTIENIYSSKDNFIDKFDPIHNNFIPIKYKYLKGFGCFIFINLICIFSIYLFTEFNFVRYLYLFQLITYYFYFFIFI